MNGQTMEECLEEPARRAGGRRAAAFALALLALLAPAAPAPAQQPSMVGVDAVRVEPLEQTVPVIGRLVARQAGVVAARIGGPVGEVLVDVGDRVKAGDVLAVLVKDTLRWQVKLREADVARETAAIKIAEAQLKLKNQELARLERLRKSAAFNAARFEDTNQEMLQAQSAAAEAQARLLSSRANLELARISLGHADIRAPFDGVVSQRQTQAGAYLQAGAPVVTLINDRDLEIEADVPAVRVSGLLPGTVVAFDLGTDKGLQAAVRAAVPAENPLTRTRTVRLIPDLSKARGILATSQSVTLHVPTSAERQVTTVHKDAVLNRKGQNIVFVVVGGQAKIRPVELGEAVGPRFQVTGGLKPGDVVVVRGNERLRPNQDVTYAGMAPPAPGAGGSGSGSGKTKAEEAGPGKGRGS
ncbi:MAG: efflux RND transporter periplasmic adaptor subunit [Hyphomicrobiales bacterium]|nr:efflux RND transporter periplasmic adaptor subunit [Hyphomicrobiales bacterium]MCP5374133.1 efflux RND transporter periplasmic adaptor subunit [Hyphomicrobiales bacterium]